MFSSRDRFVYCFLVCFDRVESRWNKAKYHWPTMVPISLLLILGFSWGTWIVPTMNYRSSRPCLIRSHPNPLEQIAHNWGDDLRQKFLNNWLTILLGWESMMIWLRKKETNDGSWKICQWMDKCTSHQPIIKEKKNEEKSSVEKYILSSLDCQTDMNWVRWRSLLRW